MKQDWEKRGHNKDIPMSIQPITKLKSDQPVRVGKELQGPCLETKPMVFKHIEWGNP